MSDGGGKPVPLPDNDSLEFWAGTAAGELRVQSCRRCKGLQFYPRALCTRCGSQELDWVAVTGRGTIFSFTVVRRHQSPWWAKEVPYVVAMVQLSEGPIMLTNVVDCDPQRVHIGMNVAVTFRETGTDGIVLPLFSPAAGVSP